MNTILFDGKNSFFDYNLILLSKTIGFPETRKTAVEIPGMDGELDFTEFFGSPNFSNRTLIFSFAIKSNVFDNYSNVINALHGSSCKIVLNEDPYWHYVGRIAVSDLTVTKGIGYVTITCDCEPWKLSEEKKCVVTVSGSSDVKIRSYRKPTIPKISTTGEITIQYGSFSWSVSAGDDITIPDLVFAEGTNVLTITGTATVVLSYVWGKL